MSKNVYNDFLDAHFCTVSGRISIVGKFDRPHVLVLVAVDVLFCLWYISVVSSLGAEKKDVFRAVGFVDGVGHVSEDGDDLFDKLIAVIER